MLSDTPENWQEGSGPEKRLNCPNCYTTLRGFIHHERRSTLIDASISDYGGYPSIIHADCQKTSDGIAKMELRRVCIDCCSNKANRTPTGKEMRLILVYRCTKCGRQQVIKDLVCDTRVWDDDRKGFVYFGNKNQENIIEQIKEIQEDEKTMLYS